MKYDAELEREAIAAYQADTRSAAGRAAGGRLVQMHTGLIVTLVSKFANHLVGVADLRQEGAMALLRAAKRYDGRAMFSTYAGTAITMAALSYRRKRGSDLTAGDNTQQSANLLKRADESGKKPEDFVPEGHPALKQIQRSAAELRQLSRRASRLDAPAGDSGRTLADLIPAPDREADLAILRRDQIEIAMAEMEKLDPVVRDILERMYLNDQTEVMKVIGQSHGVSKQRIDQIKSEAFSLIRDRIRRAAMRKGHAQ